MAERAVDQQQRQPERWARLSAEAVFAAMGSGHAGLSNGEAAVRLDRFGPNSMPRVIGRPWYMELAANFVHWFALLLWCAAVLAWFAGMPQLAGAVVAVVVINGLFSYWQEFQAERAAEALQALLPRQVLVRRDGVEQPIPAEEVVPGDLLVLGEGEAIPADARIVRAERLRLDTSALTGESRPIPRSAEPADVSGRVAAAFANLAIAGTTVASGCGEAVVYATGVSTEFGRIAQLTQIQEERPSPLQREIVRTTRILTGVAVGLGLAFFAAGTLLGGLSIREGFIFSIGIIVAFVPEGMLPTLTLSLALGVRRMAARNALVKRLSAVEALGATTVIVTDKTGTLTENEMTVREVWAGGDAYRVTGSGYDPGGAVEAVGPEPGPIGAAAELLRIAALCCDAHLLRPNDARSRWQVTGDPTEGAILVAAAKLGFDRPALDASPRLAELPFDSSRRRMSTIQELDGRPVVCVKGAPSQVLPRCTTARCREQTQPLDPDARAAADQAGNALARRGLRVLAVARRTLDATDRGLTEWRLEEIERDLTFLGFVAMEDPPRPEVAPALAACRKAGIRVVMVTGDNGLTAAAIGREIGLFGEDPLIVNGADLEPMSNVELDARLNTPELLFARVSPEHKLRLVEALQRRGEVVAVTGDGVNDAPALKRADIGVAMGATGTDVAREAAAMILTDDNFASIVAAVEEGRAAYDNIRKFITYILASNIPEAVPFIAFVLFRIPLPLTVMQILAVDLGTDLFPALALGMESPEPDVMDRPPRPRNERLLNRFTLLRSYAWLGVIEATLAMAGFFLTYVLAGWRPGAAMPDAGPTYVLATTMSLTGIVACQIGNAFACRSDHRSVFSLGLASSRPLLLGILAELGLLGLLIHVPPLAALFGLTAPGPIHWLMLVAFGPLLLLAEEARKALFRR